MGINRGRVLHKAKIYAAMFILFAVLIVDIVFNIQLERDKRQQARYNLEHSLSCFSKYESKNGTLDFNGLKCCTEKQRTSPTGDMYVIDLADLKFVYDGSPDVPKDMYFTKESIGKYFNEWSTAADALMYLTSGNNSGLGTNASYNFDGATEWLEFVNYTTKDYRNLVLVQGVQSDEVIRFYCPVRAFVFMLALLYVVWLLATSTIDRRKDDIPRSDSTDGKR